MPGTDDSFYVDLYTCQGFTRWRTLPNRIEIWRIRWRDGRGAWRALRDGQDVGAYAEPAPGSSATGHIDHDYSLVQGTRAPVRNYTDWESLLRQLPDPPVS